MTLRAVLRDGTEVSLAAKHGDTFQDLVAGLTADSLTGSAVPLADAKLTTTDGRQVSYGDVNRFYEDLAF